MIAEKMKKIPKEYVQKMIFYGLAVMIFLLPIPQFFMSIYLTKAISIQTTLLRLFLIYFSFLFAVEIINKRVGHLKNIWLILSVTGLVLTGFISVLIADKWVLALYGLGKGEGYFSLLSYYMIFLMATMLSEKRYIRKLLQLFLLFGCVIAVLGVIQFTGIYQFGIWYPGMAYAPMRNPNFYGAFAVLFTGVAMGGFYTYREDSALMHPFSWWNRWVWYALTLIGYAACISSDSGLVYVGLIMMFLLYAFLLLISKRKDFLALLGLIAGLLLLMFLFDIICKGQVISEVSSLGKQIQAEGSVFGDTVGTNRMLIWKQTIALLPEYGLFGCGLEQLGMLCLNTYGIDNAIQFDKAHNEYLNLWITEGIFALIFYLIFLFVLFIPGIKQFAREKRKENEGKQREYDEISKIVFFGFFGYIAQAFFNISVVQVAPYFWMICGLLYSRKRNMDEKTMDC